MDCLKNYIQIAGCGGAEYTYEIDSVLQNPSDLFINDLVSLRQMDKITDEDKITFLGLWDSVQDKAIRRFVVRVKAGYKELFGVCELDDDWFCTNRENLALPLQYFEASELMFERLYTDRINRYTTIDREKAKELRAEFDSSFMTELKNSLEIINAGVDQIAGELFSFVEVLP